MPAGDEATTLGPLRETLRAWERLRLLYNGILLAAVIVCDLAYQSGIFTHASVFLDALPVFLVRAVVANFLYFAGPLMELYARWLGWPAREVRAGLFTGGTLLSLFLAWQLWS